MGLRTDKGIDLKHVQENTGYEINMNKLNYLKDFKFISLKNNNLRLLSKGKLVLDKVIQEILV